MKRKAFFIFLLFLVQTALPISAQAFLLEEQEVSSKDGQCRVRYLTEKNVKGWYITANQFNCPNEGWLDGYHDLTIYNAFSQPVERIYGYFSYGYWTGSAFVKAPFLTRFAEDLGVVKATFLLARDDTYDMDYIGQMTARKNKIGDYSAFQVCNPFKLLIVTDQIPAFANRKKQQIIFKNIERHVRSVCPTEEKVLLFVSPVIEPRQNDILFYSEIDLKNHTSKNVWQEEELKKSGYYTKILEAGNFEDLVSLHEDDLDELRTALNKKISLIPFKTTPQKKHSIIFSDEPRQPISPSKFEDKELPKEVIQTSFVEEEEQPVIEEEEPTLKTEETNLNQALFLFPKPQKNYKHRINKTTSLEKEPVAHLQILSKIKKAPVDIVFTAHVDTADETESFTDFPLPLVLKKGELETGWYQIKGKLKAYDSPNGYHGSIEIKEIISCPNRSCSEDK